MEHITITEYLNLQELQQDVNAAVKIFGQNGLSFTCATVQVLIDKIIEQDKEIKARNREVTLFFDEVRQLKRDLETSEIERLELEEKLNKL